MATLLLFITTVHEDEKLITETVPVLDFISMLTQHTPGKNILKMIRYYGLYARHRKSDLKLHRAISNEYITEAQLAKELREKYMKNPPEGMTSAEVRSMSDDELLDMDYFFHEFDDINDDDFGEEGFLYLLNHNRPFSMPAYRRASFIQECSV